MLTVFKRYPFVFIFIVCFTAPAHAQDNQATLFAPESQLPRVTDLNWLNEQFLIKQRKRAEAITRRHFGLQLKQGQGNIPLLQRVLDENILASDDTEDLQALGVVLGDAYVARHRELSWRVYEDELGKSHAVCVASTKHCLFPITMLSRRVEAGAEPQVEQVFDKGFALIKPYLPMLPFED